MPRKALILSSEFPYHVTNRSNNREFFYIELSELWEIFMKCFSELELQFKCEIHAFVLMSNHYHLLISTPESNLGEAMKYLHREVARHANRKVKRINHFFGGRYKWSIITSEKYYWNAVKYLFRNPVRAEICNSVGAYPFSSLNSPEAHFRWRMVDYFNHRHKHIELSHAWLDQAFSIENEIRIGKALRRREFKLIRNKNGYAQDLDELLNAFSNEPLKKKPDHISNDAIIHKKGTVT